MHHWLSRIFAATLIGTLASLLAGCGSVPAWDPTDLLDFLDTKKPLPGERKPVFPGGVPGMTSGVPSQYVKGSPEHEAAMAAEDPTLAPPPQAEPAPVEPPKTRGKGKKTAAVRREPQPEAAPAPDASADDAGSADTEMPPAAPPPRKRTAKKPAARTAATGQTQQPGAEQQSQPQAQQAAPPFPAPLPSGTFQR